MLWETNSLPHSPKLDQTGAPSAQHTAAERQGAMHVTSHSDVNSTSPSDSEAWVKEKNHHQ